MKIHNFFLVDDEPLIRRGLRVLLERAGYAVVGEASNGAEAISQIVQTDTDVVISDVKMPIMDGIELVKTLKRTAPEIMVIMLSGFSDFELVRNAMKEGAADYLLKPVGETELLDVIGKLGNHAKSEHGKIARQKFVLDCLNGAVPDMVETLRRLETRPSGQLQLAVIRWLPKKIDGETVMQMEDMLEQTIGTENVLYANKKINETILIAYNGQAGKMDIFLQSLLARAEKSGFPLIGAISAVHTSFQEVPAMYEEAIQALWGILFDENNKLFVYHPRTTGGPAGLNVPQSETERLFQMLELGSGVQKAAQQILDHLSAKQVWPETVVPFLDELLQECQRRSRDFREALAYRYFNGFRFAQKAEGLLSFQQVSDCFLKVLSDTMHEMQSFRHGRDKKLIDEAKRYIAQNFRSNLSLSDVAERMERNTAYFSDLFKNETGMTYTDYITHLRIAEAKRLMRDPKVKMYEIGYLVGYDDPAYFSRVFRKVVGVPPTVYRETMSKEE